MTGASAEAHAIRRQGRIEAGRLEDSGAPLTGGTE